jgi:hypothetical protein
LVPIHSQAGFANAHGRMDLFLHDTSKDEMSRLPGQFGIAGANDFDAILEVRILCNFRFVGAGWGTGSRRTELEDLENAAFSHRGGGPASTVRVCHTLQDASAPRYKKVLVYLEYRYDVGAGAGRHFRFNVNQAAAAGAPASDLLNPATSGQTITTLDTTSPSSLMRYTLGLTFVNVVPPPAGSPPGTAPTTTPIRGIAAGDLAFLAAWLKTQRDGAADAAGHVHTYTHRRHT